MENQKIDFYNSKESFENQSTKIDNWCKTEANKKLINKFLMWAQARDLSYVRRKKYLLFLKHMVNWLDKDLDKVTKDDLVYLVGKINSYGFGTETKKNFKVAIKKVYDVTLYDEKKELIDWMYDRRNDLFKSNKGESIRKEKTKLAKEELSMMIKYADVRMKAFILTTFEGCCRPGEILACRISDLEPTENGFKLMIPQSKTKSRSVLLFESSSYLRDWLSQHPNNKPDSFLFCTYAINNKGGIWSPYGSLKQLRIVAKKAGITKRITNYTLRASGFTYKSSVKRISNSSMELIMGWSKGAFSSRARDYDLNTEEDAHNELNRIYGKETETKSLDLSFKTCVKCKEENSFAEEYCRKCATPLDSEVLAKIHMKQIMYEKLWDKMIDAVDFSKLAKKDIDREMMSILKS